MITFNKFLTIRPKIFKIDVFCPKNYVWGLNGDLYEYFAQELFGLIPQKISKMRGLVVLDLPAKLTVSTIYIKIISVLEESYSSISVEKYAIGFTPVQSIKVGLHILVHQHVGSTLGFQLFLRYDYVSCRSCDEYLIQTDI